MLEKQTAADDPGQASTDIEETWAESSAAVSYVTYSLNLPNPNSVHVLAKRTANDDSAQASRAINHGTFSRGLDPSSGDG